MSDFSDNGAQIVEVGYQGPAGPPGPDGPRGPTGPYGAVVGSYSVGATTTINDAADWVQVPAGSTDIVYTLSPALVDGEVVDMFVDVQVQQVGGAAFDRFNRTISVRSTSGALVTSAGGSADVDATITPHSTALAGLAVSIVVVGLSLAVQVTSPSGIAVLAAVSGSFNRRVQPGTQVVPIVTSVSVPAGPITGGTITQLHGIHFLAPNPVTDCTLDGVQVESFEILSDVLIQATSGISTATGTGNVLATSSAGGTPLVNGWQYTSGVVPVALAVSPDTGLSSGVTSVVVTGTGFQNPLPATSISFDGVTGIIDSIDSDTQIHARATSTVAAGIGDVLVQSAAGGVPLVDGWTYVGPPALTAIVMNIGQYEGGSTCTGTGTGLGGATFTVDGIAATGVVIGNNGTTFSFTVPAMTGSHASVHGGFVAVTATNTAGSNSLAGTAGFYYLPSQTKLFFDARFGLTPSAPSDGATVSAMADLTGAGNTFTQATSANRPHYVASSAANGKPAVRSSDSGGVGGVAAYLTGVFASSFNASVSTIGVVATWSGVTPGPIAALDTGGGSLSAGSITLYGQQNSGSTTFVKGYEASTPTVFSSNAITDGLPYVVGLRFDGTDATIRYNAVENAAVSAPTLAGETAFHFGFDGTAAPAGFAPVDMNFAWLSGKAWGTADWASFSTYTAATWGIAA